MFKRISFVTPLVSTGGFLVPADPADLFCRIWRSHYVSYIILSGSADCADNLPLSDSDLRDLRIQTDRISVSCVIAHIKTDKSAKSAGTLRQTFLIFAA